MNENIIQEILHELFSSMEALDTRSTALLEFLKEKGIASEEELKRHFEQAGEASNVRWRGVQVRIDYLLSSAMKAAEQDAQKESKTTESRQEPSPNKGKEASRTTEPKKDEQKDAQDKQRAEQAGATSGKGQTQQPDKNPGTNDEENNDKDKD
jgi:hypothetical protein